MSPRRMRGTAWILLLLAVLAGCALGPLAPTDSESPSAGSAPSASAAPSSPSSPEVPFGEPIPGDAIPMEVVDVVDGDTLRLRTDSPGDLVTTTRPIAVRLIGIDTPEVHPETECFGPEAADALEWWTPRGSTVLVAPDVDSWDRYDRRLFYLWTEDGTFVNLALVAEGFAEAIRVEPNTSRYDDLRAAELDAFDAGAGMWGACARG